MQKNSSKDLSWVKNIGWKSLHVSLAGGKRRQIRDKLYNWQMEDTTTGRSVGDICSYDKKTPREWFNTIHKLKVRRSDSPLGKHSARANLTQPKQDPHNDFVPWPLNRILIPIFLT